MKSVPADQVKNSNTVTDVTFKLSKTKNIVSKLYKKLTRHLTISLFNFEYFPCYN